MTITTDKGKTFEVSYAWGPVIATRRLMIEIIGDTRALSKIAADFEGVQKFTRRDKLEGDMEFVGFSQLVGISRMSDRNVQIALERGGT